MAAAEKVVPMTLDRDDEDRGPAREDFARIATWALENKGITHRQLAEGLGWTNHTRLYRWLNGEAEPTPQQVFAIERWLQLPPGTLSRPLGYLPPEARTSTSSAVAFDEALDSLAYLPDQAKRIIRNVVKEFTPAEAKQPRRTRR